MIPWTIGLENPQGTVSKSGRSAVGSTSEIELIPAVTVPSNDEHHLCEMKGAVGRPASGVETKTIYRLYARESSDDSWTQIDDFEMGDYGTYTCNLAISHKIRAGGQWRVTVQQGTASRCAVRIGGVSKKTDVKDY